MRKGIWALSLIFVLSLCFSLAEAGEVGVARADRLELGGELRLDLIAPEEVESRVEVDRVELDVKALLAEGVYAAGTLEFGVARVEVTTWHTRFSLEDHWLKVGLTDRLVVPGGICRGSLRTAEHSLSSNAFYRDQQYQLILGGKIPGAMGDWRYRFSYGAGLRLGSRPLGDHRFYYAPGVADVMIHDDDRGQDGDEFGLGLGYRYRLHPEATLDLVGFGIWSRIPEAPAVAMRPLIGWPENDQQRLGTRVVYRAKVPAGEVLLMGGFITAEDGKLDRDAWYLQAGHMFPLPAPVIGGRFLTAVEPLIRYGKYNVDTAKVFANPLTWDREQLTLVLLADIVDDVSLRIEQDFNSEKTGGPEIPNDEFRVQLRVMW